MSTQPFAANDSRETAEQKEERMERAGLMHRLQVLLENQFLDYEEEFKKASLDELRQAVIQWEKIRARENALKSKAIFSPSNVVPAMDAAKDDRRVATVRPMADMIAEALAKESADLSKDNEDQQAPIVINMEDLIAEERASLKAALAMATTDFQIKAVLSRLKELDAVVEQTDREVVAVQEVGGREMSGVKREQVTTVDGQEVTPAEDAASVFLAFKAENKDDIKGDPYQIAQEGEWSPDCKFRVEAIGIAHITDVGSSKPYITYHIFNTYDEAVSGGMQAAEKNASQAMLDMVTNMSSSVSDETGTPMTPSDIFDRIRRQRGSEAA